MSEDPYDIPVAGSAPESSNAGLSVSTSDPLATPTFATPPSAAPQFDQALAPYTAPAAQSQLIPGYAPGTMDRAPVARGLLIKRRNPVAVWLGLPLITFGIYSLIWYYNIHHEMGTFDRRRSVPAAGPLLVMILLWWTIIAPLVSLYNTGTRIANAQRAAGLAGSCSGGVGLLLMFVFGLGILYYQSELNKVHDAYGRNSVAGTDVPLFA